MTKIVTDKPMTTEELADWYKTESTAAAAYDSQERSDASAYVFKKYDKDKPRPELIPAGFVLMMGDVFAHGARKYDADNWRKCDDPRRYIGAALRHVLAYSDGETLDPESGLSHLGHAAASLAMLWGITEGR